MLTKDAINIHKGINPAIKTGTTDQINHWEYIIAEDQINGAAAQIHHVTLFGFVKPFKVFFIYNIQPIEFKKTVNITIQYNSIYILFI